MVLDLRLADRSPLEVLCLGAHADDIEIGCGGTILELLSARDDVLVRWVVLSGEGARRDEAVAGASSVLGDGDHEIVVEGFRDGFFPYDAALKEFFEDLKARAEPDLILTHYRHDRHQDHRTVSDLTWNTFRDHLVLEYEVPKYDGDLGRPSLYVPLSSATAERKVACITESFPSQSGRDWFEPSTFLAMMRLRGLECRAPSGYAEAFHAYKLRLAP